MSVHATVHVCARVCDIKNWGLVRDGMQSNGRVKVGE